jgi:hypothetical protein
MSSGVMTRRFSSAEKFSRIHLPFWGFSQI